MTETAEPRLLIVETSSRVGLVAVALGPTVRAVRRLDEARRHARDLAPAAAELLAGQGWRPRDLAGVIVSRGPGSYTGLRVGIMAAKALAYATGCALLAVDTFAAIARQAPPEVDRLDIIADAQQDKIYVQEFARSAGEADRSPVGPLVILPLGEWLGRRRSDAWVSGPGLHVHRHRLPEGIPVADSACWDPQPESLLAIGLARYQAGQRDDVWALEPLYLRPSAAEQQWQQRP
ncbi:MAG TPA: tRNA (adenosine(37)-N6)-threonylcarbamoyltransferase complex dimerization subunit type 1 TsaB [Gemmataceae bacterium]|nr:tRNA (adenosine(37)-N6)-threonylcarbamoyltransferase complex dimerization subunit type 1 TsaB [Gemmataceae bacterium]